ncbi:putative transmembrane protein, partial [Toxoplasma gondii FOU]
MPLRCSFLQYAASSIVTFDCLLGFSGYRIASRKHSASNGHEYPNEAPLVRSTTIFSYGPSAFMQLLGFRLIRWRCSKRECAR